MSSKVSKKTKSPSEEIMDRFKIAINKNRKQLPPKSAEIVSFGFDAVLRSGQSITKIMPPYRLDSGITVRVGIVFQDPKHMFTASKVHYHNRTFFLCKSTENQKALCCTAGNYGAEKTRPYRRIICPIVIYGARQEIQEVRPWVFGNSAFRKLNEINQIRPLNTNDFFLQKSAQPMDPWDIQPCSGGVSLWQQDVITRDRVLGMAVPIFDHRQEYLGKDLSNFEMSQLLAQPSDRSRQVRQPVERQRSDYDSFFQNIQTSPRERRARDEQISFEEDNPAPQGENPTPQEEPRRPDIDLDEILGNI
jgi:hypothetical protein